MRVLGHALACGLQAILWFRCAVRVVAYGQHTQPDGTSISMDCRTYMPLLADGLCWWMVWGGGFVGVWACRVCGLVLAGSRMGCGMGLSRRAGCRGSCRRIRVTGGRPRVCPGYAEREGARCGVPSLSRFGCGGVLLSHTLPGAVPSPCQVLASGFGMGPGVSPGPWPPQIFNCHPTGSRGGSCGGLGTG